MNDFELKNGMEFKIPSEPRFFPKSFKIYNIRKEKNSLLSMEEDVVNVWYEKTLDDRYNVFSVKEILKLIKIGHWVLVK